MKPPFGSSCADGQQVEDGGDIREVFRPAPAPFFSFPYERGSDSSSVKIDGPHFIFSWGFPGGSKGKDPVSNGGHLHSKPGSGRSPGEGEGRPLQMLPGESRGQRSLGGHVRRATKSFLQDN